MSVLTFGEVLFDVFGDVEKLGGAPLNVAAHIVRLGEKAGIISAIGNDRLGLLAKKEIEELNVDTALTSILDDIPTGVAEVTLCNKNASYSFNYPCAWDCIEIPKERENELFSKPIDVLYYGTLASRDSISRNTLIDLLENVKSEEYFFDINIRKEFHTPEIIRLGLKKATVLKLNEDEVPIIAKALGITKENYKAVSEELFSMFPNLKEILLTLGKAGSTCITREGKEYKGLCGDVKVVDTVGAGDSFSAAFMYYHLIKKMDLTTTMQYASKLADFVVSKQGAIPYYTKDMIEK